VEDSGAGTAEVQEGGGGAVVKWFIPGDRGLQIVVTSFSRSRI